MLDSLKFSCNLMSVYGDRSSQKNENWLCMAEIHVSFGTSATGDIGEDKAAVRWRFIIFYNKLGGGDAG